MNGENTANPEGGLVSQWRSLIPSLHLRRMAS